jgi:hypothetical protein
MSFLLINQPSTYYRGLQAPWDNLLCLQQAEIITVESSCRAVVESFYVLLWLGQNLFLLIINHQLLQVASGHLG